MFARFSVKRPVTITMMILIVLVLGAVSFSKLHIDLLPQMELPYVMIQTSYSGAGPEEVENMVTSGCHSGKYRRNDVIFQ